MGNERFSEGTGATNYDNISGHGTNYRQGGKLKDHNKDHNNTLITVILAP